MSRCLMPVDPFVLRHPTLALIMAMLLCQEAPASRIARKIPPRRAGRKKNTAPVVRRPW